LDEDWLLKAAAYVELNPVKTGVVENAWDYRWSVALSWLGLALQQPS
jgi:hypothetical protein